MASECRLGTSLVSVAKDCLAWRKSGRQEEEHVTREDLSYGCPGTSHRHTSEPPAVWSRPRACNTGLPHLTGVSPSAVIKSKVRPPCREGSSTHSSLLGPPGTSKDSLWVHVCACVCPCTRMHVCGGRRPMLGVPQEPPTLLLETWPLAGAG